ncbi:transketolase family protein [Tritrichomonas foetus]|uniref:transketolase n=1 Tax=Tritrichomonas foetus TaxID=1144522 RepID=A0A1J4KJV1_9EUKA|nr:transketolase family protein [Tritrichomonas foetus]|eukprot:OHT10124.1 transketolase family protein [Tritrichomonas foetus]
MFQLKSERSEFCILIFYTPTMTDIDTKCINAIRVLSCDAITKAKSGHPGAPLGLAPVSHILWSKYLQFDPQWINRDRFVLSCGHASSLYYSLLHIHTKVLEIEDMKNFRQYKSKTPGHPERHILPEVEVTTGPLGQGISNAVGLSVTSLFLAERYNKPDFPIFNHKIFCIASDGDLMEGVQYEAASFAGHQKLNNLICFWDNNHITITGNTDLAYTENVPMRFRSQGWHTISVENADTDLAAIEKAIDEAIAVTDKPVLIDLHTTIGFGSDMADSEKVHGNPLSVDQLKNLKKRFGYNPEESFVVPQEVYDHYAKVRENTAKKVSDWNSLFQEYGKKFPKEYAEIQFLLNGQFTAEMLKEVIPLNHDSSVATRISSGIVLNKLAAHFPGIIGGSADLAPSNNTVLKGENEFGPTNRKSRQIEFGIREHAMQAIANGIAYYGMKGLVPFTATFFVFLQYLLPSLRCACLENLRVLLIMTHDSIGVGEDGSTHQPTETLAQCRSMPNINVFRPCDQLEVSAGYATALTGPSRPTVLVLSRQGAPLCEGASFDGALKGAYVIKDAAEPKCVIVATGTEVSVALKAAELCPFPVRVVSMPSMELFMEQTEQYRREIIPANTPVLSVEAGVSYGWEKFSHKHIGVNDYGLSAPCAKVFEHFGIVPQNVAEKAQNLVKFYEKRPIPELIERP